MAQTAALQVVGLNKILKKLDHKTLTAPAQKVVFRDLAVEGSVFLTGKLSPRFPRTAASVNVSASEDSASIKANRHPYVFFERGSQYPVTGPRRHRRRVGVKTGQLRIKPRRFLSATRSQIREVTPKALDKAAQSIEKVWAS